MPLPHALRLPQAAGQSLLARTPTLCPPGSIQVTAEGLTSRINSLMLQQPLVDTLPASAFTSPAPMPFMSMCKARPRATQDSSGQKRIAASTHPALAHLALQPIGAGLKMLSWGGLCASCPVILQRGKLRPEGMPDWFLCPEAISGGILVSMNCSLHSQQPAPCLGLNPCPRTTKEH